jgi:Protein of unknown function (DUF2802)
MTPTTQTLLMAAAASLAGLALLLAAFAWSFAATGRRLGHRLAALEGEIERLRGEVNSTAGLGARIGERVRRLDQLSAQVGERLGQLELRGEGRPYDQAIALVRRGGGADRLVSHYGLSRGEADLVTLLHGARSTG